MFAVQVVNAPAPCVRSTLLRSQVSVVAGWCGCGRGSRETGTIHGSLTTFNYARCRHDGFVLAPRAFQEPKTFIWSCIMCLAFGMRGRIMKISSACSPVFFFAFPEIILKPRNLHASAMQITFVSMFQYHVYGAYTCVAYSVRYDSAE